MTIDYVLRWFLFEDLCDCVLHVIRKEMQEKQYEKLGKQFA